MESGHSIAASTETYFRHTYDLDHEDMRRLYEQAKRGQWNASRDVDWATPVPDDGEAHHAELAHGVDRPYPEPTSPEVEAVKRRLPWRASPGSPPRSSCRRPRRR